MRRTVTLSQCHRKKKSTHWFSTWYGLLVLNLLCVCFFIHPFVFFFALLYVFSLHFLLWEIASSSIVWFWTFQHKNEWNGNNLSKDICFCMMIELYTHIIFFGSVSCFFLLKSNNVDNAKWNWLNALIIQIVYVENVLNTTPPTLTEKHPMLRLCMSPAYWKIYGLLQSSIAIDSLVGESINDARGSNSPNSISFNIHTYRFNV